MLDIKLNDTGVISDLISIHDICPLSDVSILLAHLNGDSQTIHLSAVPLSNESSTTQAQSVSRQAINPHAGDPRVTIGTHAAAEAVYAVGSYTKVIIAYATACFLEAMTSFSWNSLAQDVFNSLLVEKEGDNAPRIELYGKPTLRQLLCHYNGFAPMNEFLFAPDGSFILSKEEFLRIAPAFTEDYYRNHNGPWHAYSNANHIFMGMILEMWKGKDLNVVLEEVVFKKLGMKSTTIDPIRLEVIRNSGKLVDGFQISSSGSGATVDSRNLLRDSIESGSMGMRSSLEDLASFNMELLRTIGNKKALTPAAEDPFVFFFGDMVCTAGLVSQPSKGEFQFETPTIHLLPNGHEWARLGKQQGSKRFGAPFLAPSTTREGEKLLRGTITHKAGYIDGFSSNVIVFEGDRAVLVILANTTGPFDIVHHISQYFLQKALNLEPKINFLEEGEKKNSLCSKTLEELENRNLARNHDTKRPGKIAGTYRHTLWEQQITIDPDGSVFFHGSTKRSRTPMALTFIPDTLVRIVVKSEFLSIEGWSVWRDMDFVVGFRNGHDCLIRKAKRDVGDNVEEVEHVYERVDS